MMGRISFGLAEAYDDITEDNILGVLNKELPDGHWSLEVQHHRWMVEFCGRPKFLYDSEERARNVARTNDLNWTVVYAEQIWLVMAGDSWIYTSLTQEEALAFCLGLVVRGRLSQ